MFGQTHETGGERSFVLGSRQGSRASSDALVAALAAMGIEPETHPSSLVVGDGVRGDGNLTYYFKEESDCGSFKTPELIARWSDEAWRVANALHPWAYVHNALQLVTVGNREPVESDLLLAALQAMGVKLSPNRGRSTAEAITAGDGARLYASGKTSCGRYTAAQLLRWWSDEAWHLGNPHHVFAYVKCALFNLLAIRRRNAAQSPLGRIQKGKRTALIPLSASNREVARYLRRFEQR